MRQDTRIQLIAAALVFLSVAGAGAMAPRIAATAGRAQLAYTERAEKGDPPEVALGVALGAFRGLFVNLLWFRAEQMKRDGKFHEAIQLSKTITKLQPHFPRVWTFLAWNMAYNISVATNTAEERWRWVQAGIDLLRQEGIPKNPKDVTIHKELAWIFFHKIQGVADDANQYYKRQLARKWTFVLGPPPPRAETEQGRVERRVAALRTIAQAPRTLEQLHEQEPRTRELVRRLREEAGLRPGLELLKFFELRRSMDRSWARQRADLDLAEGRRNRAMERLIGEEDLSDAWAALIPHVRQRLLVEEFNMDPERMIRYTELYGPLDWRHAASHALYWATRGVEEGMRRRNIEDFDFTNTDRVILASVQELFRWGTVEYNLLNDSYISMVNLDFADAYGRILRSVLQPRANERQGPPGAKSFEHEDRAHRNYAAGYENFLQDVTRTYYRMGNMEKAQEYFDRLRNYAKINVNDPRGFIEKTGGTLEEFIKQDFAERATSPQFAQTEIFSALRGAFLQGLLRGDRELYEHQRRYARDFHKHYMSEQNFRTLADRERNRMQLMPSRFVDVEAMVLVNVIRSLISDAQQAALPIQASQIYGRSPLAVARAAYDDLVERLKPHVRDFDTWFPEPPGMEEYRQMRRRLEERSEGSRKEQLQFERN